MTPHDKLECLSCIVVVVVVVVVIIYIYISIYYYYNIKDVKLLPYFWSGPFNIAQPHNALVSPAWPFLVWLHALLTFSQHLLDAMCHWHGKSELNPKRSSWCVRYGLLPFSLFRITRGPNTRYQRRSLQSALCWIRRGANGAEAVA